MTLKDYDITFAAEVTCTGTVRIRASDGEHALQIAHELYEKRRAGGAHFPVLQPDFVATQRGTRVESICTARGELIVQDVELATRPRANAAGQA